MTWRTPFVSYLCWGELTITLTLNSLTSAFPNNPTWNFKADFFHQSIWKGCKKYATLQPFPLRRQLFEKNLLRSLGWSLTHYICLQSQCSPCLSYCKWGCLIYFSLCSCLVNILTTPFTCAHNRPTDNPRANDLMQRALLTLSVWMRGGEKVCVCVCVCVCLCVCFIARHLIAFYFAFLENICIKKWQPEAAVRVFACVCESEGKRERLEFIYNRMQVHFQNDQMQM